MKRITFDYLQNENVEIESIKNSGFDLIITSSLGEELRIEEGLTELVTSRANITLSSGSTVDYKQLVEKLILDDESIKTLDINFVGDSQSSNAADKEGTGVEEGALKELRMALKKLRDEQKPSDVDRDVTQETKAETEAEVQEAIAEALEEQQEEAAEKEQQEDPEEQAEETNKHVEEMKNKLRVEEVEPNENTSKQTGDYDTPPAPSFSSNNSGKYKEEGEPKEEETYEFTVKLKGDSDSGAKGDFITNVAEPVFTGTGVPMSIVTITINGTDYAVTVDAQGYWTLPPIPKLDEGEYTYTAKDNAGNNLNGTLVIDQTNEITADLENDTGVSDSDGITQDTRLVFVGKTDAGAEVVLKINGKEYKTTANADGEFSVRSTDPLNDGEYEYEIISTDIAGNEATETGKVVIDTKIEATVGLSSDLDSGASDSDGITNKNENIVIAGKIEQGATAFLHFNGVKYPVQIQKDGTWSVTINGTLPDDNYDYRLEVSDLAGNTEEITGVIVIDTDTYVTGSLDKKSDSGESNSDGLTSDTKPWFSGQGEPNAKVTVSIGNGEYTTTVAKDGSWTVQVTDALPEGDHTYTIKIVDIAGNTKEISDTITIDTGVTVSAELTTDSGASDSDGITNIKNNTISGKTEAGATGTISINGGQRIALDIKADGSFEYHTGDLKDGDYTYTIEVEDRAGNTASTTESFTVDTTTHVSGDLDASSDSGSSSSDGITNDQTPTLSGKGEPKSTIVVTINNKSYETTVDSKGNWSLDVTDKLSDGKHDFTIVATDVAGNTAEDKGSLVVDSTNPTSFVAKLDNDSGELSGDWLTKHGKLQLSGSVEVGCDVKVIVNGRAYGKADDLIVNSDGTWSFELPEALKDGKHDIEFVATDVAGNDTRISKEVEVDTKTSIEGGLADESDSGESNSDNITNDDTPTFKGVAEANSKVVVNVDGKDYTLETDATGKWEVTVDKLADGKHDVVMTVTDRAGNTATISETVTIDTVAPVKSTIQLKNDTGSSARDFITKDNIPSLKGKAEAGSRVEILVEFANGEEYRYTSPDVVVNNETGEWSFVSPIAFPDGSHKLSVISTDAAGNQSVAEQTIVVDTSIELTVKLDDGSDSGVKGDGVTNETNPTFKGTGTAGDEVTIKIDGNYFSTVIDKNGDWSIRVDEALAHRPDMPYEYEVTVVDTAGNSTSKSGKITIDTETKVSGGLDSTSDSAEIDGITNENKPLFSGRGEASSTIVLDIEGKIYETTVDEHGRWSIQINTAMPDKTYNYSITATDLAGNSKTITNTVTIDTKTSVSGGLDAASDSAAADSITKVNRPAFSGKAEAGATLTVSINGKEYTTKAAADGSWKIQVTDALPDNDYSYKITSVDTAGNKAELPEGKITIDTKTFVSGGLMVGSDTGADESDGVTNKNSPSFGGKGEVGATVTLSIDGREYTAIVADNGTWSIDNINKLSDGEHEYQIKIVDVAGNTESISDSITVDTTDPLYTPASLETDTGSSSTDMITKEGNLVFVGRVEDQSIAVSLSINGKVYRSPSHFTVGSDGSWRFALPEKLAENNKGYDYTISYTDLAGNTVSETGKVVVDTTNTVSGGLMITDDSGKQGDNITSVTKPRFSGKSEPDSQITLSIDGKDYKTTTDKDGNWSVQVSDHLSDGEFDYTITSIDKAGNVAEAKGTLVVDTTASSLSNINLDNDSNIADDWVTKYAKPALSGQIEVGAELTITIKGNGKTMKFTSPDDFTVDQDGNWSLALQEALLDGTYNVKFEAVDKAGNESSADRELVIDTTISVSGRLSAASDSGESDSDQITSNKTPIFTGRGEAGATVTLTINGKQLTTEVDKDGYWSIAVKDDLKDGKYQVDISIKDLAGNTDSVPSFEVTIDTQPPSIDSIKMTSDTGSDNADGITNEDQPVFKGKTEPNARVVLEIGGAQYTIPESSIDNDGNWTFTVPAELPDGDYSWKLLVTDAAGNTSERSGDITVDTVNTVSGGLSSASDSGDSNTDNLTYDRTPVFEGKTDPSSTVTIRFKDGTEYTTTADSNGNWSVEATTKLASGKHDYEIISVDVAGNEANTSGSITVDYTAPQPTIKLVNDTGESDSDGITKSRTPILSGTSEAGASIELTVNNITYSEPAVKVNDDGTWNFVLPIELRDGDYVITVVATDKAGNSASQKLDITIDNSIYIDGEMKVSSDTGVSDSDGVTKETMPEFEGRADAGATVTFEVNGRSYSTKVGEDERWELAITDPLPEGTHDVKITVTDIAGNTKTYKDSITIDKTAEIEGGLDKKSDSGESNSDKYTKDNKPLFSGRSEAGAKVVVTIDGESKEVTVDESGSWQVQWENVLADGTVDVEISVTDIAGNQKTIKETITIDTTKPDTPVVELVNDTGLNKYDGITNKDRPELAGKVVAGERITLTLDGRTYTSPSDITIDDDGNWSFRVPVNLDDDKYEYTVVVEDKAGNTNQASGSITVDTKFSMTAELDDASDTGKKGDGITSEKNPVFKGMAEEGAEITLVIDGQTYETTAGAGGAWSISVDNALSHGNYDYVITGTDVAGNTDTKRGSINVDTATDIRGGLDDSTNSNLKTDLITNSEDIKFSGTGEAGAHISITINGKTYETNVDDYGRWEFTVPEKLPEGDFKYEIIATDAAGNTAELSETITIDRTNFVNVALKESSDTGLSKTDGITSETRPTFVGKTQAGTDLKLVINNSTTYDITINSDGTFEFQLPSALLDGRYEYSFVSMDVAGNRVESKGVIVVDTVSEATAELDDTSDTGIKDDKLTNDPTPTISGTGEEDSTITLKINNKEYTTTVDSSGDWSITIPDGDKLPDGRIDYTVVAVDVAGNVKTIKDHINVDTTVFVTAAMTTDTGRDPKDGITQETQPSFEGTLEKGAEITITINNKSYTTANGVTVNADGTWSFTLPPADNLSDGSYKWTVSVEDAAGNTDAKSGTVVVDTTDPTELTVDLKNGSVSDTSITNNSQPEFAGRSEAGSSITVKVNGQVQPNSLVTVSADGSWSFTAASKLNDGDYVFEFISMDAAGNSQTIRHDLTIDTSITIEGSLDTSTNSGSQNDLITNKDDIKFSGSSEADALIQITINGKTYETTADKGGKWSLTLPERLDEGNFDYTIKATDAAGNTKSISNTIVIDRTNTITASMKKDSDSGSSDSDGITKEKQPTFVGETQAGSTVQLVIEGGNTYDITVKADGSFEFTFPSELSDGDYVYSFVSVDTAGNLATVKGSFEIDTVSKGTGALDEDSDSGLVDGKLTNNKTPEISGTGEKDAVVELTIDGHKYQTTVNEAGEWSITLPKNRELSDGKHDFTITITDKAGNVKTINDSVTVDTHTFVTATLTDDTGRDAKDGITQANTPTFTGTMEKGTTITFSINNKTYTTSNGIKVNADGTWSFTLPDGDLLPDGSYKWVVTVTDDAGNTENAGGMIVVDTTDPTELTVDFLGGSVASDEITKIPRPEFGGQSEKGSTITVKINGKVQDASQITVNEDGTWNFKVSKDLDDGDYKFEFTSTDAAGNSQTISHELTVDTITDVEGGLSTEADTGASTSDGVTRSKDIKFDGTGEKGAKIVLNINGQNFETVVGEDGTWSIDVGELDGSNNNRYDYTITSTDVAGNTDVEEKFIIVDTAAPIKPTFELDSNSDSSAKKDWITNSESIVLNGVAEAGTKLSITVGTAKYSLTVDETGTWSLDLSDFEEGVHKVTVISTDLAGNTATHSETLTVDRSIALDGSMGKSTDTGSSQTDGITSSQRPVFSGTTDPRAVVTITIKIAGGGTIEIGAVADGNGKWTTNPDDYPKDLDDGTYEYDVVTVDEAGNTTSYSDDFVVDTKISVTIDLDSATNSSDKSDNLTNVTKPRFSGVGQARDSIEVKIFDSNGDLQETIKTTVGASGAWSADVKNDLSDGTYRAEVTATDKAGNSISKDTTIEIDATDPTILDGGLDNSTNTGDTSDNITRADKLKFSGKVEVGCEVDVIFENGDKYRAIVMKSGDWIVNMPKTLPDGVHKYSIIATDKAGNTKTEEREVVVDRTISFTGDFADDMDSGWSDDDNHTNINRPVFEGKVDAFSVVQVKLNSVPPKTIEVTADADGNYSVNLGDLFGTNGVLPDGTHSLTFLATDPAGNVEDFDKSITIDTKKPTNVTVELADSSDSGKLRDFITNDKTPVLKGTSESKDVRLKVRIDKKFHDVDIESDGTWTFAVPELADGEHDVVVIATDKAGNKILVKETLVIDTQEPDNLSGQLSAMSDKGDSSSDGLTNENKNLRFNGMAEAGATAVLIVNGKSYKAVIDADGRWDATVTDKLDDGQYTAELRVTDKAGNTGVHGIAFEIDTSAPTLTGIRLLESDDMGEDNSDNVTNVENPTIVGKSSEDTASVWITIDGTSKRFEGKLQADGNFSAKLSGLGEGTFTYTVHAVDKAGNETSSDNHKITIDTRNNLEAHMSSETDSGSVDGITNNQRPKFEGTTDVDNTVTMIIRNKKGQEVFRQSKKVAAPDFEFTVDKNLPQGDYTWEMIAVDKAGNVADRDGKFTIDTVSTTTAGLHESSDTGLAGDGITNKKNPMLSGQAEDGSKITIEVTGVFNGNTKTMKYETTADESGEWMLTLPDEVTDGRYTFKVKAVDKAGNTSSNVTGDFTVDRTPPTVSGDIVTDSGSSSTDKITNGVADGDKKGHLDFAGTTSGNASKVVLAVAGRTYTITPEVDGSWEFVVPDKISDGKYEYSIYSEDTAGNRSPVHKGTVTLDTTIVTTPNLSQESDTGVQGDNLTNKNKPIISGTGEPNLSMTAVINGGGLVNFSLGSVKADADGKWRLDVGSKVAAGLSDGSYVITFSATDVAGNEGTFTYRFTVDTTPPDVHLNKYNAGEVTTDKPKISGSGEVGAEVHLVIGEEKYSTKIGSDGQWEFNGAEMLSFPDGQVNYYVYAIDKAGNRSESVKDTVTINTGTFVDGALDSATDTGYLDSDGVTQNRTPIFKGNGESGGEVTVEIMNSKGEVIRTYTTIVQRNGVWEIVTPSGEPLPDGTYSYIIKIEDATGITAQVEEKDLIIDNTVGIESIRGWSGAWGGTKHGDTWYLASNDNSMRGKLDGNEKGAEVKVVINGVEYIGITDKKGNFTIALDLPDGSYTARVYITDVAGNKTDTTVKLDVDSSAEWTSESIDDVTGDSKNWVVGSPRPRFEGDADPANGHRVRIEFFGEENLSFEGKIKNGRWTIDPDADIPDGTYSYRIIYWEKSGRWAEKRGTIIIDTTNEVMSLEDVEKVLDDQGNWTKTKVTGFGEPNADITVTVNGVEYKTKVSASGKWSVDVPVSSNGEYEFNVNSRDKAGNEVNLSDDPNNSITIDFIEDLTIDIEDGASFNPADLPLSGTGDVSNSIKVILTDENGKTYIRYAAVNSNGKWSVDLSGLPDGNYNIKVKASSNWGEKEVDVDVVIDTTAPVIEEVGIANDTGDDTDDGITSENQPIISGKVNDDTHTLTIEIAGEVYNININSGAFSFEVPVVLDDGSYDYTIIASDRAGNTTPVKKTVVIQSKYPEITHFDIEGIKKVNGNWVFNNSDAEMSGKVDSNTSRLTITIGTITLVSGRDITINEQGIWSIKWPDGIAEGAHIITIKAENDAGLVTEETIDVVFDKTPPELTDVKLENDTNIDDDGITTENKPTISGKVGLDAISLTITIDGKTYESGKYFDIEDGTWMFTVPEALQDGDYTYTVVATDAAGNASKVENNITIQNEPPELTDVEIEGAVEVDGELVTNNPDSELSGRTGEDTSKITITIGDKECVSGKDFYILPDGSWRINLPADLAEGKHTITIKAENEAGGFTEKTIELEVDTTPPQGSGSLDATENDFDDENTITNNRPVFSGQGEVGATVIINIDGKNHETTVDQDGNWRLELPTTLSDGKYLYIIDMVDKAGNKTQIDYDLVFVDSQAKSEEPPVEAFADDVQAFVAEEDLEGNVEVDEASATFSGEAEYGDLITLSIANQTHEVAVDFEGSWSIAVTHGLTDGTHDYVVTKLGVDGNEKVIGRGEFTPVSEEHTPESHVDLSIADDQALLSGNADANSEVLIDMGEETLVVTANEDGEWSAPISTDAENVTVTLIDEGEKVKESVDTSSATNHQHDSTHIASVSTDYEEHQYTEDSMY